MPEIHSSDVLVVGGGIAGTNVTFGLASRGCEVILVEAGPFVGGASSGVNAGTLSPMNTPPKLAGLAMESMRIWSERDKEIEGGVGLHVTGGIRVAETPSEVETMKVVYQERKQMGLPVEYLHGAALRDVAPYLSDDVVSAVFSPLEGYADVLLASENVARAAKSKGARIFCSCKIRTLEAVHGGFRATAVDGRTFVAPQMVLSAGLWCKPLGKQLGLDIPLDVRINQMAITEPCAPVIPHIILHANRNLSVKQKRTGNVLIGGGWPGYGTPGTGRAGASYETILGNACLASRVIPALRQVNIIRAWAGFDGRMLPGQLPFVGPVNGIDGLFMITSCSGGFILGPILGEIVAEMVVTGRYPESVRPFAYGAQESVAGGTS